MVALTYELSSAPSSYRNPTLIDTADLDNDGDDDLVIGFRGYENSQTALGSGVVVMWNEGGDFSSGNSTGLPESRAITDVAILPAGEEGVSSDYREYTRSSQFY